MSYIVGTWNFVNISSSRNSNESSGTLTLKGNNDQIFIEIARDGQLVHGTISCVNGVCSREAPTNTIGGSGSWYYDGEKLELSYIGGPGVWFTVIKTSPTHIELTDDKGDTIHLMSSHDKFLELPFVIAIPADYVYKSDFPSVIQISSRSDLHFSSIVKLKLEVKRESKVGFCDEEEFSSYEEG